MRIMALSLKINLVSAGGAGYDLDIKLNYLKSKGHDVSLTTIFSADNKLASKTSYQIFEKNFSGNFLDMQEYICDILKDYEKNTDVYYLHGPVFLWAGGKYRKKGGCVPVIIFINTYTPGMNLIHTEKNISDWIFTKKQLVWEKIIGLHYAKYIDKIIADSPVVKNIYSAYGVDEKKITVMPNFIDLKELKINGELAAQPPFAIRKDYLNILYAGRLVHSKGIELVIRAINLIDKEFKNDSKIFFHIVGDGPQSNEISSLIKKLKLEDKILMYGWKSQKEMAAFYKYADLFIHPVIYPEPFGRTIVEAMYFNKPIITSINSGSSWVMGKNGLSFKNNDVYDLKNKILKFYNDRSLLDFYGHDARERAEEFDYRSSAEKFENILMGK